MTVEQLIKYLSTREPAAKVLVSTGAEYKTIDEMIEATRDYFDAEGHNLDTFNRYIVLKGVAWK